MQSGCLSFRIYPGGIEPSSSFMQGSKYEVLGEGEGLASSFNLFWIFPVTPRADINRAVSEAVAKKNGDALIDVRWWHERNVYILGIVNIIHVSGKVVRYTGD